MEKILFFALFLSLFALPVFAASQNGINTPGIGIESSEIKEAGQGAGQGQQGRTDDSDGSVVEDVAIDNEEGDEGSIIAPAPSGNQQQDQAQEQEQTATQTQSQGEESQVKVQVKVKAKNANELKAMIQEKRQEMAQELNSMSNKDKQKVFQNQNQVREAVHALLASEDLVGGIGKQVSEIALEFNNSVEKTIQAEEKIQTRSKIKTFFFGGDKETAEELEEEVGQNQNRIQELKQLKADCSCQQEVMAVIQEQVQNMEQEQTRLSQLTQEQKQKKGLFSWLFGWLK